MELGLYHISLQYLVVMDSYNSYWEPYGPIAQLAPGVYAALFYKKANKNSIILGLIGGVLVTLYYQYFSESSIYDLHPGLLGIS